MSGIAICDATIGQVMSALECERAKSASLEIENMNLRRIREAAEKLEAHWKAEHAHFACGGEAILLEALAKWRAAGK